MITLVTFASPDYTVSANLCVQSAYRQGVDRGHVAKPTEPSCERGYGHWKWKPKVILEEMANCQDGSHLIYADAGIEFIDNVSHVIDRMGQDIFLFGNQWEHAHWCKRDIIEAIWPYDIERDGPHVVLDVAMSPEREAQYLAECARLDPWQRFGKQVQASVIFFRVSDYTRKFVKEWLDWCLFEGGRLIDDSPSRTPNHPEFRENRHDQAILTTMAYRDGIKLHWWPAQYNDGAFVYERGDYLDEGYPVLFHHHRRRNHEWSVAA